MIRLPSLRSIDALLQIFRGFRPPPSASYRKPTPIQRTGSLIPPEEYFASMRQVWSDIPGACRKDGHPAPFPASLASRLIRISSYVEDVVVDPFLGTGTTMEAAHSLDRSSIGYEADPVYVRVARRRLERADLGCGARRDLAMQLH